MTETSGHYNVSSSPLRPQPPPSSFEAQLKALPPPVRSVAESLALRDMESARRYAAQFLAANGVGKKLSNLSGVQLLYTRAENERMREKAEYQQT